MEVTNSMLSRTIGALYLGPTRNIQGTLKFLSLKTGEVIVWRRWMELPVPQDVIDRLKEISGEQGKLIIDEEKEEVDIMIERIYDETDEDENEVLRSENAEEDIEKTSALEGEIQKIEVKGEGSALERQIQEDEFEDSEAITNHAEEKDAPDKEVNHGYNLRPSRDRDYSHKFSFGSVKVGLQKWGGRAVDALNNELNLFIKKKVFEKVENLSQE